MENPIKMDDLGVHHFRKPPFPAIFFFGFFRVPKFHHFTTPPDFSIAIFVHLRRNTISVSGNRRASPWSWAPCVATAVQNAPSPKRFANGSWAQAMEDSNGQRCCGPSVASCRSFGWGVVRLWLMWVGWFFTVVFFSASWHQRHCLPWYFQQRFGMIFLRVKWVKQKQPCKIRFWLMIIYPPKIMAWIYEWNYHDFPQGTVIPSCLHPLKTNMNPPNRWLVDVFPRGHFQISCLELQGQPFF